jgi:hypothetical protein
MVSVVQQCDGAWTVRCGAVQCGKLGRSSIDETKRSGGNEEVFNVMSDGAAGVYWSRRLVGSLLSAEFVSAIFRS